MALTGTCAVEWMSAEEITPKTLRLETYTVRVLDENDRARKASRVVPGTDQRRDIIRVVGNEHDREARISLEGSCDNHTSVHARPLRVSLDGSADLRTCTWVEPFSQHMKCGRER